MNGQPGIIVRYVAQHGRYEVLTPSPNENPTVALKPGNVRAVPRRLPIPQKQERGCVFDPEVGMMNVLAELLVRKTDDYTPSDTMLQGYAAMALQQIDMDDRMNLSCLDMEQSAAYWPWLGCVSREKIWPQRSALPFCFNERACIWT